MTFIQSPRTFPAIHPSSPRLAVAWLALVAVVTTHHDAIAQSVCGPDQVAVDAAGHCCRADQRWDASRSTCTPKAAQSAFTGLPFLTAPVAVTFVPETPGSLETLTLQPVTGAATRCNVPCTVTVPQGYLAITGHGTREFQTGLQVPYVPLTVMVNSPDRRVGAYVAGSILTAVGVAGAVVGATFLGAIANCSSAAFDTPGAATTREACNGANDTRTAIGAVGVVVGVIGLGTGLTALLSAATSPQHPLSELQPGQLLRRPIARRDAGVRFTGLALSPTPGGGMAGVSLAF